MKEMQKHINMTYVQTNQNYNLPEEYMPYNETYIQPVYCDREKDFGKNNITLAQYDWFINGGYQLICPNRSQSELIANNQTEALK